jgi:hypothetical protein
MKQLPPLSKPVIRISAKVQHKKRWQKFHALQIRP